MSAAGRNFAPFLERLRQLEALSPFQQAALTALLAELGPARLLREMARRYDATAERRLAHSCYSDAIACNTAARTLRRAADELPTIP